MYAQIHGKVSGGTSEDEATSCIFGPLRMLGTMAPGKTWAACLHLFQCGHLFPEDFEPTDVDVRFWPRFPPAQRGYVEPDVHIIGRRGVDVRTVLVEVKCGAGLGNDQLLEQWKRIQLPQTAAGSVLDGDELRRRSAHVLLGYVRPRHRPDVDDQEGRARDARIPWGERLVLTTWGQFALRVEALEGITGPLRVDVLVFLRRALGVEPVAPFMGIELAGLVPVSGTSWFFREFDGVRLRHLRAVRRAQWVFRDAVGAA